jgi:hypothetical protein
MARLWGASAQCRKDECVAIIRSGLKDPGRVQAAIAALDPYELNALALAKEMGGEVEAGALAIALRASGVSLPSSNQGGYADATTLIRPLVHRGLFLTRNTYDLASISSSDNTAVIFADERLLVHVGPPSVKPLDLQPAAPPSASMFRRPQAVTLDIIGILQSIHDLGGLQLTQTGTVRVNDARKVARAMGWQGQGLQVDGLTLPDPIDALASVLLYAGLLSQQGPALVLQEATDRWATRSYAEQVGMLLRGFVRAHEWLEGESNPFSSRGRYRAQGRWALTLALAALPIHPHAFYAVDDLDQALFGRIGDYFSLRFPPHRPYYYRQTPEQIRVAEAERRAKLRAEWLEREKPWVVRSLSSWLYYLGVVELGMEDGMPTSVRLTDLGRALLHPESAATARSSAPSPQTAWIVQPNLDIVVYLERVTPVQLAFLERHAERINAQQHTAHYRLTRESVYQGLEAGTELHELLAGLHDGAAAPVPSNVVTELRAWGERRERMTLRRRASLLEFPDKQARQAALQSGLEGVPVADRFVLLNGTIDPSDVAQTVDYAGALERCLAVAEDGTLDFRQPPHDLLIEVQLARWAERTPDGKWQLTASSVGAATKAGGRVGDLLTLLHERLTHPIPLLLTVAVRAWSGEILPVELAPVTVLRCRQAEVFAAIVHSDRFRPWLRGQLAPDVLVVATERLAEVQDALAWAGFSVSQDLVVVP